uniref:DUF1917 domain-containing protein n=1 Tax=Steinernema glaseri TaxID=37863 RepID=A0A1I7Y698_9BILA
MRSHYELVVAVSCKNADMSTLSVFKRDSSRSYVPSVQMASDSLPMDSVPPTFCLDVMGNLDLNWRKYGELAKALTGRWKAAARSFADNIHDLKLRCKVVDGQWSYVVTFRNHRDDRSTDELLAMSRRYIRCCYIVIITDYDDADYYSYDPCPKEKILNQLIPWAIQQLRPSSRIFFQHNLFHLSRQDAELCFLTREEADLVYRSLLDSSGFGIRCFGALGLKYYGPESETFLSTLIMEAIVNAWDKADNYLYVCTPRYTGLEEVLSVPVPPGVSRRLLKAKDENKYFMVWSKEKGSMLSCTIDYVEHKISFNSPPEERVYDPNNMCL